MVKGYTYREYRPNFPYRVNMTIRGKQTYIGDFKTAEEATAAYKRVRAENPTLPRPPRKKKDINPPARVTDIQRRPWRKKEKEILQHLIINTTLNYKEIGERLNRTEKSIYYITRKLRDETKVKTVSR